LAMVNPQTFGHLSSSVRIKCRARERTHCTGRQLLDWRYLCQHGRPRRQMKWPRQCGSRRVSVKLIGIGICWLGLNGASFVALATRKSRPQQSPLIQLGCLEPLQRAAQFSRGAFARVDIPAAGECPAAETGRCGPDGAGQSTAARSSASVAF